MIPICVACKGNTITVKSGKRLLVRGTAGERHFLAATTLVVKDLTIAVLEGEAGKHRQERQAGQIKNMVAQFIAAMRPKPAGPSRRLGPWGKKGGYIDAPGR